MILSCICLKYDRLAASTPGDSNHEEAFLVFLSLQHVPHLPELSGYHAMTFSLALSNVSGLSRAIWSFLRHMVVLCSLIYGSYQLSKCQTYPARFDLWFLWDFMLRYKLAPHWKITWHTFQYSCVRPQVSHPPVPDLGRLTLHHNQTTIPQPTISLHRAQITILTST
jgi:hypothetical protein